MNDNEMYCLNDPSKTVKPIEWDDYLNHILSCGCVASPNKIDHKNLKVISWIIDNDNCEN